MQIPSNDEQRPDDVGDNKGMPREETHSHSLADYDLCSPWVKEEFEGSSLTLGCESFVVTIVTSLPTKMLSSCKASERLSNQSKLISFALP